MDQDNYMNEMPMYGDMMPDIDDLNNNREGMEYEDSMRMPSMQQPSMQMPSMYMWPMMWPMMYMYYPYMYYQGMMNIQDNTSNVNYAFDYPCYSQPYSAPYYSPYYSPYYYPFSYNAYGGYPIYY